MKKLYPVLAPKHENNGELLSWQGLEKFGIGFKSPSCSELLPLESLSLYAEKGEEALSIAYTNLLLAQIDIEFIEVGTAVYKIKLNTPKEPVPCEAVTALLMLASFHNEVAENLAFGNSYFMAMPKPDLLYVGATPDSLIGTMINLHSAVPSVLICTSRLVGGEGDADRIKLKEIDCKVSEGDEVYH